MSETILFLGWTDEVTACDLCGKTDLKSTAALEVDGETVFYGCVCAARALAGRGVDVSASKIRRETERAHEEQIACGRAFDRGLYEREYLASIEAVSAFRKEAPALGEKIGLDGYGGFHASVKIGRAWERFESRDLNAVAEWIKVRA